MNLSGVFAPMPTPFDERRSRRPAPADTRRSHGWRGQAADRLRGPRIERRGGAAWTTTRAIARSGRRARRSRAAGRSSSAPAASRRRRRFAATQRAAELGADAVLVRTPGFFKSQMTSRRLRPALHGRGRRVAGPGAALQLHRGHRREPAGRRGRPRWPRIRTSSGMKESGGDVAQIADLVASTPAVVPGARRLARRRSTRRCASGVPAASSRSPASCPTRACACSS